MCVVKTVIGVPILWSMSIQLNGHIVEIAVRSVCVVCCSVADPDPIGSGLFGSPGSESGKIPDQNPVMTKGPLNSNFLVI